MVMGEHTLCIICIDILKIQLADSVFKHRCELFTQIEAPINNELDLARIR